MSGSGERRAALFALILKQENIPILQDEFVG
jgi:hypothetical protein